MFIIIFFLYIKKKSKQFNVNDLKIKINYKHLIALLTLIVVSY